MTELNDRLLRSITGHAWQKIGVRQHHGINLPLSALHSKNSGGIGEFFDLIPIIDWCQKLKIDFIQLLPLNNSEADPSPYNAISSCALNIVYLSLYALPFLDNHPDLRAKLSELTPLNTTKNVAYADVFAHKLSWLRSYFNAEGNKIVESSELQHYIQDNPWVEHYALFKTLTDHLAGTPPSHWPAELRSPTPAEFQNLTQLYAADVSFYITLQYLCYSQLKKLKSYANSQGVYLMGDLPILVRAESTDVWEHPTFFDLSLQAGAPPDFYNKEGQNWGFPIYNWDAQREKNFDWLKQRLRYAENFYNIFRLDHVLGFFRIWAIPPGAPSKEGHFVPEDENEWEPQGRELLTTIVSATKMLPIAEDLGMVPDIVRPLLNEMGICGTKVMRWEKNHSYNPIHSFPPVSISCVSTHDSETTTLWWKTYPDEAKEYAKFKHWTYAPELTNAQRQEILWDSHHSSSLFHVNLLQEYLALFPELIWSTPEEERINIPGTFLPSNWTYRFRPSVEEMTSHNELFSAMERIIFFTKPL